MNPFIRVIGFRRPDKYEGNPYCISECRHCHAILEFLSDSVSSKVDGDRYIEYVVCPECNKEVIFMESRGKKNGK